MIVDIINRKQVINLNQKYKEELLSDIKYYTITNKEDGIPYNPFMDTVNNIDTFFSIVRFLSLNFEFPVLHREETFRFSVIEEPEDYIYKAYSCIEDWVKAELPKNYKDDIRYFWDNLDDAYNGKLCFEYNITEDGFKEIIMELYDNHIYIKKKNLYKIC